MSEIKSDSRWSDGSGIPDVVTVGDPRLREIAEDYKDIQKLRSLADKLVSMLREMNGAGLAASQIGSPERIAVVEVRKTDLFPDRPESPLYVMINPRIVESAGESVAGWEGCFSVPGLMAKVTRPERVLVNFVDLDGMTHEEWFEGYVGRVVQHEIDHLNGQLFTDIMEPKTLSTVANWKRFELNE